MPGKLFVVGVGPGDPELLTIKAARILNEASCIFVPKGREEGSSLALSIIREAVSLEDKEIVKTHFPMFKTMEYREQRDGLEEFQTLSETDRSQDNHRILQSKWSITAEKLIKRLNGGISVAFITIGDPTIYSTFFYIFNNVLLRVASLEIEIVPGISSINAAAAKANKSLGLGNEKIAILPANYLDNLRQTIENFDTVVLMKINKVYDEIVDLLSEMKAGGKINGDTTVVSRAFMPGETITTEIEKIDKNELGYFSLMIIRK